MYKLKTKTMSGKQQENVGWDIDENERKATT